MSTAGSRLTGRISAPPDQTWHDEVLGPQFQYDVQRLLPWYLKIEGVLLREYQRMRLISGADAEAIGSVLDTITPAELRADPTANMSDVSFAIERYVLDRLSAPVPAWHVDRSRNDLQATAQLLAARGSLINAAAAIADCADAAVGVAELHVTEPMPGFTHLQPAQVITPGFYLSALSGELISTLSRLLVLFDEIDLCPLGAGAMAGQELAWDRSRMASLLGFSAPQPHPLTAVAGRAWALRIAAECSTSGVTLSRFVTDLMAWGGGGLRFIELPDRFSGISSAMPQKKNYPVLERIRGRLAHLTAWYVDLSVTQRNTPYANSVEVSKETGSASLDGHLRSFCSALALLRLVLEHMEFLPDRMREACLEDYLGGFSLANLLVSEASVPWRTAQVIVGEYIVAAGRDSVHEGAPGLLRKAADRHGYRLAAAEALLEQVGEPERLLRLKQPEASAHPSAVTELLARQRAELSRLDQELTLRADRAAENSAVTNTSTPAQTSA